MEDLTDYRGEIDEIDAQLIPLFERRMEVVRQVAAYKKAHGLPVLHQGREQEVRDKAVARLQNPAHADAAERFMNAVMAISRAAQDRDILSHPQREAAPPVGRVGFYGAAGSFSEEALIERFGEGCDRVSCPEFEDVFTALRDQTIDYGVLPIENSSTGAITQVYDLLGRFGFYIVGEKRLLVRQNLVGTAGTTLDSITTVYSHAQGIEQSGGFLARFPGWKRVPFHSTSLCASRVAEERDVTRAAIASARAAAIYGLQIIAPDIQDSRCNTTRFIVIGREMVTTGADKVSLTFSLDNESGTLYKTLRVFADGGINLVKIESRPIPEELWNYRFYLDFEGDVDDACVRETLAQIARGAKDFRLLGAYRSDT